MENSGSGRSAQILVMEDEPKLAALLRDYLLAAGYRVTCLDNGLDAPPHPT